MELLSRAELKKMCEQQYYPSTRECLRSPLSCFNGCNRRGKCVSGWCHCRPGHFGADCSLSLGASARPQLLAGTGYRTRGKRPWVYIYELPPELMSWWVAPDTAGEPDCSQDYSCAIGSVGPDGGALVALLLRCSQDQHQAAGPRHALPLLPAPAGQRGTRGGRRPGGLVGAGWQRCGAVVVVEWLGKAEGTMLTWCKF